MSKDSSIGPRELIDLSPTELRRRFEEGRMGVPSRVTESLRNEAALHYHSDPSRAMRIARRAVEWASLSGDPLALAWGLRAQAEALLFSGRMADADSFYARAVDAARRARSPGLLGQILVARTHLLAMLGRYRHAESAARSARSHLAAAGDDAYLAKLAMNLGSVHFQREQHGRALEQYDRAAGIFARMGIRDATVLGLEINRGVVLSQLDRDDESLSLFQDLERECEEAGQGLLLAQVRMNSAVVRSQRGEFDLALSLLARAADHFRKTDHPAYLASCLLNRAEIYHQLNLSKEAGDLAAEAVPLFKETGLVFDAALAETQSAMSHLELGNLKESLSRVGRARRAFARETNEIRVTLADLLRAEILRRRGRSGEARELTLAAAHRFREWRLFRWESAAVMIAARVETDRGSPNVSIDALEDLLKRVSKRLYPLPALQATIVLGEAQEKAGRFDDARRSFLRAARHLDDLRIRIPTEDSKIAFLSDKTHLYDRLISMELSRVRPSAERMLDWMERSREQSLRDRLRSPSLFLEAGAHGGSMAAVEGSGGRRRRLSWLHARLSRLELDGPARKSQAAAVRRKLHEEEAAWARAVREAAESQARAPGRSTGETSHGGTIDSIARSLPEGWGFVSYHLAPGGSLVIAIADGRLDWRPLNPKAPLRAAELADRLDFQWATAAANSAVASHGANLRGLRRPVDALLGECHREFWEPVMSMGFPAGTRWLISPHGPLHRIPFPALHGSRGYLVEQTDLAVVPGARAWLEMPDPPDGGPLRGWVAGVPVPELPGVLEEVDRICRMLGPARATRDIEPTASSMQSRGGVVDLLHIATHGRLREDNPAFSSIDLADGPLFVHDLANHRYPRAVVILSACSSGGAVAPSGEEWIGIGRGFLLAGASTVVAPLWPIHEGPTLTLLEEFYGRLFAGRDPVTAMGDARRSRCRLSDHPWEWAGFAVVGGLAKRVGLG